MIHLTINIRDIRVSLNKSRINLAIRRKRDRRQKFKNMKGSTTQAITKDAIHKKCNITMETFMNTYDENLNNIEHQRACNNFQKTHLEVDSACLLC